MITIIKEKTNVTKYDVYQCEVCDKQYTFKQNAINCERSHIQKPIAKFKIGDVVSIQDEEQQIIGTITKVDFNSKLFAFYYQVQDEYYIEYNCKLIYTKQRQRNDN